MFSEKQFSLSRCLDINLETFSVIQPVNTFIDPLGFIIRLMLTRLRSAESQWPVDELNKKS